MRKSPRGKHTELWHHISGCRQWFKAQRDTTTHEIFETAKINEEVVNDNLLMSVRFKISILNLWITAAINTLYYFYIIKYLDVL